MLKLNLGDGDRHFWVDFGEKRSDFLYTLKQSSSIAWGLEGGDIKCINFPASGKKKTHTHF